MAINVYKPTTLDANWFEDRCQPEGGLSATGPLDKKFVRAYETDIAYIGERFDVCARVGRVPVRPSYATPDDGFREVLSTNRTDLADPNSRSDWGKGKAISPPMITTENAPVRPPETRELPGERSGFGAHLNRHGEAHGRSFFDTSMGDYFGYGPGHRATRQTSCPSLLRPAGLDTEHEENKSTGMKVGVLCGESFNESFDPAKNTRGQRSWLYQPDIALRNIEYGAAATLTTPGTRRTLPKSDSHLSLPLGAGAMAKVRSDLAERKGRLGRVATEITKNKENKAHRSGVSIFMDG
eukprot:TRINITY_DN23983_c0_g1_i1.p1 TRINITY_DN23983_c0_g1~~TRINITY_DN23983_c0_g1_i1.p1  ORF type:complete len:313 (+),score=42.78 TRINITY_DN23983_c0_g1_i1:53-940(+)